MLSHPQVALPVGLAAGAAMWVAARVQLKLATDRRQRGSARASRTRSEVEEAFKMNPAAEKAASCLTASRDVAWRIQRRITWGSYGLVALAVFVFGPATFMPRPGYVRTDLAVLAPEVGAGLCPSNIGTFVLSALSLGLAVIGSPPADSRTMRKNVHNRVFFYFPLFATVSTTIGAEWLLAAQELSGMNPLLSARGVGGLVQFVFFLILLVTNAACFVPMLYPTDRPMAPREQLLAEQRARLVGQLGEARAAAMQRPLWPAWYPPYLLEGAGYYALPASRAQELYMDATAALFLLMGLLLWAMGALAVAVGTISGQEVFSTFFPAGLGVVTVGLMMARPVRRRLQRWLIRRGARGAEKEAAGVAALMGNVSPADALSMGRDTFRGLPVSAVGADDLGSNADSGMFQRTKLAPLGSVDAFVSHSWHDNGAAKYRALKAWADGFEAREKRSPLIWLDKACIDQTDIATALACLPVYLAGCSKLVIFAGPTYVERLWCVVEIYTFLRMGGSLDQIEVHPFDAAAMPAFETFEAEHAKCYSPDDKAKLLGAIQQAFGSTAPFNELVRSTLSLQSVARRLSTLPPASPKAEMEEKNRDITNKSEEKATAEADKTASKAEKEEGEDPSLWV